MKTLKISIALLAVALLTGCSKAPLLLPATPHVINPPASSPLVVVRHISPPPHLFPILDMYIYAVSFDSSWTGTMYNEVTVAIHHNGLIDSVETGCGMVTTNTIKHYSLDTVSNKTLISFEDSTHIRLPRALEIGDSIQVFAYHFPAPQFWVKAATFVVKAAETGNQFVRIYENNSVYPSFVGSPANGIMTGVHLYNAPNGIVNTIYLP